MDNIHALLKNTFPSKSSLVEIGCGSGRDESTQQLIGETKTPISMSPGNVAKYDYEYKRNGVCSIFLASEPLSGKRLLKVTPRRTKKDWAHFLKDISIMYPSVKKITLVMDNLNTHTPSSLYETFAPKDAKELWDRFEFVYTP